jgi:hypothetical protein
MSVKELTPDEARVHAGLVGVISWWGRKTYYGVPSLDEWRRFVTKLLGYY